MNFNNLTRFLRPSQHTLHTHGWYRFFNFATQLLIALGTYNFINHVEGYFFEDFPTDVAIIIISCWKAELFVQLYNMRTAKILESIKYLQRHNLISAQQPTYVHELSTITQHIGSSTVYTLKQAKSSLCHHVFQLYMAHCCCCCCEWNGSQDGSCLVIPVLTAM